MQVIVIGCLNNYIINIFILFEVFGHTTLRKKHIFRAD